VEIDLPDSWYLLSYVGFGFSTSKRIATSIPRQSAPEEEHETPTARQQLAEVADKRRLLSMLGLSMQKTRTAEGLAGVLRLAVPDASITVEEFHPVWREVNDPEPRRSASSDCSAVASTAVATHLRALDAQLPS